MSTHAFNKKCAIHTALVSTRVNTIRGRIRYMRAHSQYAGKAPAVGQAEQNAEDNRHCDRVISMSPSFLPAALITNT